MKMLQLKKDLLPLVYHNIFAYPLTGAELIKWRVGRKVDEARPAFVRTAARRVVKVKRQGINYFFLRGRRKIVAARLKREIISKSKLEIAKRAAKFLALLPTVQMVAVTGSLAMQNAGKDSDIDLMVITQRGTLWLTRLISLISLISLIRRVDKRDTKDKLCLNLWLDESDLIWPGGDRNLYSAHEIAQIVPLVNKNQIYERFIWENRWIQEYWPNAVKMNDELRGMNYGEKQKKPLFIILNSLFSLLERLAFRLQYLYMKPKITHERVSPTRAIFHPRDLAGEVQKKLRVYFN